MDNYCKKCGRSLVPNAQFCMSCGTKVGGATQTDTQNAVAKQPKQQMQGTWYQNGYKIRKKVLAIGNKYWIEDASGNLIGFCKQKILKLKEDIRIYSDESMTQQIFKIQQEQIFDAWGTFVITDSQRASVLGYIKRGFLSDFGRDAWEIQDVNRQPIGRIFEQSLGRALARKYLPGGGLVPEQMTVELNGKEIAKINQDFKIIGDIWNMDILDVPPDFDRRVLLACMLLMGNIERDRK